MKKLLMLIICLFPLSVFAYTGPLDEDAFYINNQTAQPFQLTINSNSSQTATFHLVWDWYHAGSSNLDLPGSYLFFSIVSDKKIEIDRNASFGNNCNNSCFSNDDYLQLVDDSSGYSYVYYFNIVKWQRNVGTQVDLFNVDDVFKFTNKEIGTANVYIYGAYSDTTNQIPQYINNTNTLQEIIIGNDRQTQELIDNQNEIYEKIIDSQYVCKKEIIDFSDTVYQNYLLNSNGNLSIDNGYSVTDFILFNGDIKKITTQSSNYANYCFYDKEKTLISCSLVSVGNVGSNLVIPNGAYYFRTSISSSSFKPTFEMNVCVNGNQANNNAINDLNDNITSNDIDSPNSDFSDMEDMVAENGVITNLITLPITLYQAILNNVNGTCSNYSFGQLYGTDITFSCISLQSLLGNTIFSVIDILFSGFTIYKIAKKMIKVFNNMSSLKEGDVIDD